MDTVFMDWALMYFEAPANNMARFGYSRDHRSDRPGQCRIIHGPGFGDADRVDDVPW